ncbi:hypothetical protein [Paeniglutamicibacter terrestris]|uniref:DUF362 domain-containing protein n=1 Tax=Paeniglutamicibacter terrestris TaxID=2723403 RepID=A0ABX1G848_9MICC|nr:hypothetical protein [Paeniglutamicibacter terrestris]NKG22193.1 hypothetical protein [Paeniglutamicibacter terrestris]
MTKRIAFTDIDVSADGWIRCNVTRETTEEFRIQLPYSFVPSPDLIAAAYASLCGQAFDEVEIALPIGPEQVKTIEQALQAKLIHLHGLGTRHRPGTQRGLNFSGGFDSLAAKEILKDANLISLDFGGNFSRERNFFERFNPFTIRTNMTALKLNTYGWQFMGIGSILLRDELQLGSYSFGSILAGSLPRLFSHPLDQSTGGIPVANALGMKLENPVTGVTEIGALQIVAKNHPGLLVDALMSVALPHEDKFQRKYQMVEAVSTDLNIPTQLPEILNRSTKINWGGSFATDLSSLYVIKTMGVDYISPSYVEGIPANVVEALEQIDISFMSKVNPQAYHGVDKHVLGDWYNRLTQNNIMPYDRKDWFEAAKVMRLLRGE